MIFSPYQVGAAIGVMVTASHNPKDDNGYKVFWSNGPQILSPHDLNIQQSIMQSLVPQGSAEEVFSQDLSKFSEAGNNTLKALAGLYSITIK